MQPLKWGEWPDAAIVLSIEDMPGKWSFRAPYPCGDTNYVLVTPFDRREEPYPVQQVVLAAQVRVPVTIQPKGRKHATVPLTQARPVHPRRSA